MRIILSFVFVFLLTINTAFAGTADEYGARGALQQEQLSVQQMLQFAIDDEYLARSEYLSVLDSFGQIRPFVNIVRAEERHIDLIIPLFIDRGWDVPVDNSRDKVLGVDTLAAAFVQAQAIETDNIAMYEHFLQQEDLPEDVEFVFSRLLAASKKHLISFQR